MVVDVGSSPPACRRHLQASGPNARPKANGGAKDKTNTGPLQCDGCLSSLANQSVAASSSRARSPVGAAR